MRLTPQLLETLESSIMTPAICYRMEKNLVRLAQKLSVPVRSSRGIRGGPDDMLNLTDDASSDEESSNLQQHVAAASKNAISSEACLPAPLEPIAAVPPLLAVLLALAPPSPLPRTLEPPPLPLFNVDLNESQRTALSRALAANELHLIHGPPGTGKTTLLVELVMQLVVGRGERVLVTGSSNLAVDNLGIRLVAFGSGKGSKSTGSIKCCRIGHPARILPALGSHTLDYLSSSSSAGQILSDVRKELQSAYSALHSPNPWTSVGNKSSSQRGTSSLNNKRLTGSDRRKAWEEVRELRKELKQRERGLFTTTLGEANVVLSTLHGAASGMLEKALRAGKPAEHVADSRQKRKFDTIIIDEACQAIEASTWGAVLDTFDETRGGRLILAGDDQQLGPVVKSEKGSETKSGLNNKAAQKKKDAVKEKKDRRAGQDRAGSDHISNTENLSLESSQNQPMRAAKLESEEELSEPLKQQMGEQPQNIQRKRLTPPRSLSTTLFTRILKLYGSSPTIRSLLTVQYRMNEAIMAFPNHEMYGGKLIAHESCKNRCLGDGSIPSWKAVDTDAAEDLLGGRVVFYDTAGAELYETTTGDEAVNPLHTNSKSNSHEVELVHGHVRRLLDNGLDASSITLLAPYSAQVSALAARFPASEYPGIEIGTIDALQGREQDVVIISLVRSNEEREIGFLNEKKRLNVAMTRAKRQLVVVGDSDTIRGGGGYLARWMTWLGEHAAVEPILS